MDLKKCFLLSSVLVVSCKSTEDRKPPSLNASSDDSERMQYSKAIGQKKLTGFENGVMSRFLRDNYESNISSSVRIQKSGCRHKASKKYPRAVFLDYLGYSEEKKFEVFAFSTHPRDPRRNEIHKIKYDGTKNRFNFFVASTKKKNVPRWRRVIGKQCSSCHEGSLVQVQDEIVDLEPLSNNSELKTTAIKSQLSPLRLLEETSDRERENFSQLKVAFEDIQHENLAEQLNRQLKNEENELKKVYGLLIGCTQSFDEYITDDAPEFEPNLVKSREEYFQQSIMNAESQELLHAQVMPRLIALASTRDWPKFSFGSNSLHPFMLEPFGNTPDELARTICLKNDTLFKYVESVVSKHHFAETTDDRRDVCEFMSVLSNEYRSSDRTQNIETMCKRF